MHISTPVTRVRVKDNRATGLEIRQQGGEEAYEEFDLVISTTPSYVFPRLVPELPEGIYGDVAED